MTASRITFYQEHFQDTASFLVNQTGNTFHSTTSGQTPNSRLRDTLDVITEHLTMPLGTPFPNSLPPLPRPDIFAASRILYKNPQKLGVFIKLDSTPKRETRFLLDT
ncbi:hypothetical protein TNCT_470241 [Trichonephila clavata]|uniref:Uncharacterized protein n=1 Tax=Trichonephila clavata TaxID=2740835 RepID=A0A8X6GNU2_TRICU|nr:hypothetical protein TNCT_470241 [Trichonephila clavata]